MTKLNKGLILILQVEKTDCMSIEYFKKVKKKKKKT